MPTFHCFDPKVRPDTTVWHLPTEESHHLVKVLRAREGDRVFLLNGQGLKLEGTLALPDPKSAKIDIHGQQAFETPRPGICLAVCIPKPKTIETIVRQATEMGVFQIHFLDSERSEVPKGFLDSPKKLEKFYKIAQEACKQSENPFLPEIRMGQKLTTWLEQRDEPGSHWVAHPARDSLTTCPKPQPGQDKMWILVGAEGGLTEAEFKQAAKSGFSPVNLGRSILRVETACVALCARASM